MTGSIRLKTLEERLMPKRLSITIISIIIFTVSVAYGAVDFIYPSPSTVVTSSGHLILKLNQTDVTSLRITHNGIVGDPVYVGTPEYRKLFHDFFIAQSLWDPGVNKLVVDLFNGGQKTESVDFTVFYSSEEDTNKQKAPPEYTSVAMHRPEKERLCQACHVMNPTPAQMNSNVDRNNPCFICHKKMLAVKYVHGPAGTYSCGYCHASKGTPKHAVPKRGAALCYECHSDMSVQLKKKKFVHGPVDAGMCDACHDPHGSQNEAQLLKPINELCLSCHDHIRRQKHVVRASGGEGHPLSGKSDPSKKGSGRQMSCISCHAPHGGDVRYFFTNNVEDRMNLCQMCHNK
jgi:predicted CXXCH cytochrome family protein